jgi:hypothetical protein
MPLIIVLVLVLDSMRAAMVERRRTTADAFALDQFRVGKHTLGDVAAKMWTGIKVDFCPEGTTGLSLGFL